MIEKKLLKRYFPGIILFVISVLIAFATYQDYGIAWDEPDQRSLGAVNYAYVTGASKELLTIYTKEYGAGFELPLTFIEKKFLAGHDIRDIYLMRHLVAHLFFLVSALFGYVLAFRLFKNQFIACLGYVLLVCSPAIYAHSYFNTKDIPLLSMFIVSFTVSQAAFEQKKAYLFLLLGVSCGYTTAIRVMGVMLSAIISLFLLIDIIFALVNKKNSRKILVHTSLFLFGFFGMLLLSWPYLWRDPVHNFMHSFAAMSKYNWDGTILTLGKNLPSLHLPWYYFPIWFLVTNPLLWLLTGIGGVLWILINAVRRPLDYVTDKPKRNFLLYLLCFGGPIFAVYYFHSVLYDGWRHLYFIYPSFVFLALYFIHKIYESPYRPLVQLLCALQVCTIGYFMIRYHPFQQVYFNELVSRKKDNIRKNFEFDYWGPSYYQGLEYLLQKNKGTIKLCYDRVPYILDNNLQLLQPCERARIQITDADHADYFISTFRNHPEDFPNPEVYSIIVLNSTVMRIYRTR